MAISGGDLAGSVTPQAVHTHIPQRPVFTDTSTPSLTDVRTLIVTTARAVIGAVGVALPAGLVDYAAMLVEVGTAAKVEQSYWPEQQVGNTATAEMLWSEYNDGISRLVAQALRNNESGGSIAFGQISTHRRTAKLWRSEELSADLERPGALAPGAGVIGSDDTTVQVDRPGVGVRVDELTDVPGP